MGACWKEEIMNRLDRRRWGELRRAENELFSTRKEFVASAGDIESVLREALAKPHERGTALRFLETSGQRFIKPLISDLVDLASVGHSDIELCRRVILFLGQQWLVENLEFYGSRLIRDGGEEEYRRIAELYLAVNEDLLGRHVQRALENSDPDIREVGEDFRASVPGETKLTK